MLFIQKPRKTIQRYKNAKNTQTIHECNNSNKHSQKIAYPAGHRPSGRKRTKVERCNLQRARNTNLTNPCNHTNSCNNFGKCKNKKQIKNIASQAGQTKVEGCNLQRARNTNMTNQVTTFTNKKKQTKIISSQAGQTKVEGCRRRRRGNVHKKEEKGLHRAFVFCPETECKYKYNHKNENTKTKIYKYNDKQY